MIHLNKSIQRLKHARILYFRNVIISPNEVYRQISNVADGISFEDTALKVYVVDCRNTILNDITEKVYINEFTHDSLGTTQIAFELINLGLEYGGRELFLRFEDENNPNNVWFSNPLCFTALRDKDSVIFDYWSNTEFQGISYLNSGVKQRIRIGQIQATGRNNPSQRVVYNQRLVRNGDIVEIGARFQKAKQRTYSCYHIVDDTYDDLTDILAHDIVYLDGIRVTNKPTLSDAEYIGQSNLMSSEFVASLNELDTYNGAEPQIKPPLSIISLSPIGTYLFSNAPDTITASFNYPIELGTGTLTLYKSNGDVVAEFTESDIIISDNSFTITYDEFDNNTAYYILFSNGLIVGYDGINTTTEWTFKFSNGNYSRENYSTTNYFTD